MTKNRTPRYSASAQKNMSVKEASEYWDKHSFFDFDDIKEVRIDVRLEGEEHYILLEADVVKGLEHLARRKKKSRHTLANKLLKQSLREVV